MYLIFILKAPIAYKLDGFLPAVCTKCDVDHTGGQKFSVYRDGQPVKSTMTLEFMEIRILTQQNYQAVSPVSNNIGGCRVISLSQTIGQFMKVTKETKMGIGEGYLIRR